MPNLVHRLLLILLLVTCYLLLVTTPVNAQVNISSCILKINPNPIFSDKNFTLEARSTNNSAIFFSDRAPYSATITHSSPAKTESLGVMKMVRSDPNVDEESLGRNDPGECIEWNHDDEGKRTSCKTYAEDLDPGDREDSNALDNAGSFRFGVEGPVVIQVLDKNSNVICTKNTVIESAVKISVEVTDLENKDSPVVISGSVLDRLEPVKNKAVSITINDKTITVNTDEGGVFFSNDKIGAFFNLVDGREYLATAKVNINSQEESEGDSFNVGTPIEKEEISPPNAFLRDSLSLYHNSLNKDYWSTSTEQATPQSPYTILGPQADLVKEAYGDENLVPLYDCLDGENHFTTTDFETCNKTSQVVRLGFIYKTEISNTLALYNCIGDNGDSKVSTNEQCIDKEDATTIYENKGIIGYGLTQTKTCVPLNRNAPVVSESTKYFSYFVRAQLLGFPSVIVEELKNNPKNNEDVCIGVDSVFLVDVLGFELDFTSSVCSVLNIAGLGSYCKQYLKIGDKDQTYRLGNETDTLYRGNFPPGDKTIPNDPNLADVGGTTGDSIVEHLGGQLGTCSGFLSVMLPCSTPKPDSPSYLREEDEQFEKSPTGDVYSRMCFFFQAYLPEGVVPKGFPECNREATPSATLTTIENCQQTPTDDNLQEEVRDTFKINMQGFNTDSLRITWEVFCALSKTKFFDLVNNRSVNTGEIMVQRFPANKYSQFYACGGGVALSPK